MKNRGHRVHPLAKLQQATQGRSDVEENRGKVLEEQRQQLLGNSNTNTMLSRGKSHGWTTTAIWLLTILSILMAVQYYYNNNHYTSIKTPPPPSIKNEPSIKVFDVPNNDEIEEAVNELIKYKINDDSRCHWENNNYQPEDKNDSLIGVDDEYNLGGLCHYSYPIRVPPPKGYTNEIDHFYLRTDMSNDREQCYMDCVDVLINNMPNMISDQLLLDASTMGLPNVVEKLLSLNLNPLYRPTSQGHWHAKTNSIQRAIQGGHADIVKLLTKGNNNLVIDSEGRTVKDYIQLKGSPIRPYFAKSMLGLNVQSTDPNIRSRRPLQTKYMNEIGDSGWSSYTAYEYDETKCDMDIVYGTLSKDDFLRDYYVPARPFVLRQASPVDEVQNFHKHRFETTNRFNPNNKFRVGPTAYPRGTGQERCPNEQSLLEMEATSKCLDIPQAAMVSGWHPTKEDLEELFPQYDGDILDSKGGFNSIHNWFGDEKEFDGSLGWQIFFGGDGSGATYHWHAAAFNILYVGIKEWRLAPPVYRGRTGMSALQAAKQLDEHYTLQCIQQPGDQVFLPNYWGHMTINHGFTIGAAAILNERYQQGIIKKKYTASKEVADQRPQTVEEEPKKQQPSFLFVHINKCGGTSIHHMLAERCPAEYVAGERGSKQQYQKFHTTAHSWIEKYGQEVYSESYTFAVVRHPLARQVSNFFFLTDYCLKKSVAVCHERNIPTHVEGVVIAEATDEQKISVFHNWMERLYQEYPTDYKFGSYGHGNEKYGTFNATQTSWLVDPQGELAVKKVYKLEELSDERTMTELADAIPCLKNSEGVISLRNDNISPSYPHYMLFAENANTKRIMKEVYAVDFHNFGYEM